MIIKKGFTLIEMLVVLAIMGVIVGLTLFGIGGAREASRDAKRKADLEVLRSAVEIYKADCNKYPLGEGNPSSVLATSGDSLSGDGSSSSCLTTNNYLNQIPSDPIDPNANYRYYSNGTIYEICAALEQGTGTVTCNGSSLCGKTCNYKVTNP